MNPEELNESVLLTFCGSHRWARELADRAPFADHESMFAAAESIWFSLPESAWLEAFAAHPRIGETQPTPGAEATQTSAPSMTQRHRDMSGFLVHSTAEQAATQQSLAPVAEALLTLNRLYEDKFGFRYIVFASGRTAPELLQILQARITQTRPEELQEAARQQHRITHLRMTKWLYP